MTSSCAGSRSGSGWPWISKPGARAVGGRCAEALLRRARRRPLAAVRSLSEADCAPAAEGKPLIWGQRRIFLNLCAGLDRIGVPYSVNDYRWAKRNPAALACIVGKPYVLDLMQWKNPILFGPSGHSYPLEDPNLLDRLPIKKILVLGPWHKAMCRPYWGETVEAWEAELKPISGNRQMLRAKIPTYCCMTRFAGNTIATRHR